METEAFIHTFDRMREELKLSEFCMDAPCPNCISFWYSYIVHLLLVLLLVKCSRSQSFIRHKLNCFRLKPGNGFPDVINTNIVMLFLF